jgi:hypothetical protein
MNAEARSILGRFSLSTRGVLCVGCEGIIYVCLCARGKRKLWVVGCAFLEAFLRLQVFLGFEKFCFFSQVVCQRIV